MGMSQAAALVPKTALTPPPPKIQKLAAADEYFGAFGMSPLSIRSTIGFLGREYHWRTISDHDLLGKALQVEGALRIWRTKYPEDPWLAPTFYHLEQLYQAVQSDEARTRAMAMLKDVIDHYPNTKQGHLSRSRLAAGFPPLIAETPLLSTPIATTPTPLPVDTTLPDSAATSPSPQPSISPTPADTLPLPSATIPSPASKQPQ